MHDRARPLRLWACGTTFRSVVADGGDQRISEALQSGVELLGVASWAADYELMHLLLAAAATLGLRPQHRPTLLVGHHGLLDALLAPLPAERRGRVRQALTEFDPLALEELGLGEAERHRYRTLLGLRGDPSQVLYQLEQWLGPTPLLRSLAALLAGLQPAAAALGVRLQFDPSFEPHFDLYDGLVFRLVCQGADAPVAIASGGRYDALVGRFDNDGGRAAGTGFAFAIESIRELLEAGSAAAPLQGAWLVAAAAGVDPARCLSRQAEHHRRGDAAELCLQPCDDRDQAEAIARERGCRGVDWLEA